jgi:hypothetical protein
MSRIIVSYRRSDTAATAGRIFDRLVDRYGEASVFMDIDTIPLGVHYEEHIRDVLRGADVVLAVIGPSWRGQSADGSSRIMAASDPVRFEIETALQCKVPVIPVLVDGAPMPRPEEVPEPMRAFCYFNAATVDIGRDFRTHMERLVRSIDDATAGRRKAAAKRTPRWLIPAGAAAVVIAVAAGVFAFAPGWFGGGGAKIQAAKNDSKSGTNDPNDNGPPQKPKAKPTAGEPPAADEPMPRPPTYRVLANVSGGIQNLRSGPALKYPIVVAIPAGATGIALGTCRPAEDNSRPWCAATWQKHSGFISSCCVVDEKTGAPPRIN